MSTVEFDRNFILLRVFRWGISPKRFKNSHLLQVSHKQSYVSYSLLKRNAVPHSSRWLALGQPSQVDPSDTVLVPCVVAAASSVGVARIAAFVPVLVAYTEAASDIPAGLVATDST